MIRIEIKSGQFRTKEGVSKGTGKPWKMVEQQIYIHGFYQNGFPSDVPRASTIQLDNEKPVPYPVGLYAIGDESMFFGDFDKFQMGRIKLVPLAAWFMEAQKQVKEAIAELKAVA